MRPGKARHAIAVILVNHCPFSVAQNLSIEYTICAQVLSEHTDSLRLDFNGIGEGAQRVGERETE
jgi:hypothetical protein